MISGEYSGPCHYKSGKVAYGVPRVDLYPSGELPNGQVSIGGVLRISGGDAYYCDGWREGGPTYVYKDINLPDTASIFLEIRYGKPEWSNYENKPTDAYVIVKVKDLSTDEEKELVNKLIGGNYGCGWFVDTFDLSEFKGHKVKLILQAKAGGNVRVCSGCTGTWDHESIYFDYVKIYTQHSHNTNV